MQHLSPNSPGRKLSRRLINGAGFVACLLLLAYAYYLQYYAGLEPCPLCIFQRVAMAALGMVFLIAAVHNPSRLGARIYGALLGLVALIGAAIAGRHVWIQNLPPDQVPACGPSLEYMMDAFPLTEAVRLVLRGSGDCAIIDWTFLGLSMPAWTLVTFVVLGLMGVVGNWMRSGDQAGH
jgi:disulfide bond formation protein DsbB